MPNKFVIFPANKKASAEAYKAWADGQFRTLSGETNGIVGLLNEDAHGSWVTVYYGPPYVWLDEVPEPLPDGPIMRADGEIADNWDRPEEEQ